MGNCYSACHASFEETISMVSSARGLTPEEVKETLARIKKTYCKDEDYKKLRSRFPETFPV